MISFCEYEIFILFRYYLNREEYDLIEEFEESSYGFNNESSTNAPLPESQETNNKYISRLTSKLLKVPKLLFHSPYKSGSSRYIVTGK